MTTRARIIAYILTEHPGDPATWLPAACMLAEEAGLNTARCIPLGVPLEQVAHCIAEEAKKQGTAVQTRLNALLG